MRRLFIIFLLFIQFLLCVNASEVNLPAQKLNEHIEYISEQTSQQKRISIDFKNYENAVISLNTRTQEIFTQRNSNNIDGFFIGFSNCDFKSDFGQNHIIKEFDFNIYNTIYNLKFSVFTRAP